MDRHRLLLGLASVFAGLTVMLIMVSVVYSPFFVLLALPFGATAYFLWFHATGRLRDRMRERAANGADGERHTELNFARMATS
ncbi:hypothetical protein ACFQE1_18800 [Halobium palmae]|uniref:Uncharacterized protein n=1 Tax=Halobium palmae TaxID=1776492 RepID=A0ABD5S3U7_9EURY